MSGDKIPEMKPKVIALYAPCHGAGKSTAAQYLHDVMNADIVSFAQDLAGIVRTLIAKKTGGTVLAKDKPIEGFPNGATYRDFMIAIGQAARKVYPDIWVDIARERIRWSLKRGHNVVVDDLRMLNEYEMLRGLGAVMVRITRPGLPIMPAPTEAQLEEHTWDIQLVNNAEDIPGFYDRIAELVVSVWK